MKEMGKRDVSPLLEGQAFHDRAKGARQISGSPAIARLLQRYLGNSRTQPPVVQAKMAIGRSDDPLERQADEMADRVVRMQEPPQEGQGAKKEVRALQVRPVSGQTLQVSSSLEAQINALRGGGQPLDSATRAFMESRFGYGFGEVRVHTCGQAAEIAQILNAEALATRRDVIFGTGQYRSGTIAGRKLIAHELMHVLQQGSGEHKPRHPLGVYLYLKPIERGREQKKNEVGLRIDLTRILAAITSEETYKAAGMYIYNKVIEPRVIKPLEKIGESVTGFEPNLDPEASVVWSSLCEAINTWRKEAQRGTAESPLKFEQPPIMQEEAAREKLKEKAKELMKDCAKRWWHNLASGETNYTNFITILETCAGIGGTLWYFKSNEFDFTIPVPKYKGVLYENSRTKERVEMTIKAGLEFENKYLKFKYRGWRGKVQVDYHFPIGD